ncbi:hypothetical protein AB0J47_05915 [Nocardia sp. NPDC049737]|uniref:hypothetical protein n=1 Tax=Nocardia sp. NPDC049737 TaxID=3154358 RepID=UPI00343A230A
MGVASTNATFAQPVQHSDSIDGEVPGGPSEGPTSAVQINRLVHLLARQTASSHRNIVPMQNRADSTTIDTKPVSQLIRRRTGQVALDQSPDFLVIETTRPMRCRLVGRHRPWTLIGNTRWIVIPRIGYLLPCQFNKYRRDLLGIRRVTTDAIYTDPAPSRIDVVRSCHTTILGPHRNNSHGTFSQAVTRSGGVQPRSLLIMQAEKARR